MCPWELPHVSDNLWLSHLLIKGDVFVLKSP